MPNQTRQLAAIMFTDIVGYTALMGKDEDAAYKLLKANRQLQKPLIEKHGGKWLKEMGDGVLASFTSVSSAVYCALEIQKSCKEDPELRLRIGIHQGEVIAEEGDVFGDGVNIASRIEPLAPIGGIYISETVYRNIENKKGIQAEFVREESLKNVKHAVRIYEVDVEASEIVLSETKQDDHKNAQRYGWIKPAVLIFIIAISSLIAYFVFHKVEENETRSKASDLQQSEKSIAVLPFEDMSQNKDQEYFGDGMMEEILNHLYKIGDLQVTSRTSAMNYKDSKLSIPEIAGELGVSTILEGSIRKDGEKIRITVQLIDGKTDKHLWSETYDRLFKDIFAIQSEVAQKVASVLKARISPEVKDRMENIPTSNMEAYTLLLEARYSNNTDSTSNLIDRAIEIDPDYGMAYVAKGQFNLFRIIYTREFIPADMDAYLKESIELIEKGLSLDPYNAEGYTWLASFYLWFYWDFDKAEENYLIAEKLNPGLRYSAYTEFLLSVGKFKEALDNTNKIIKANQRSASSQLLQGICYAFLSEKDLALESIRQSREKISTNEYMDYFNMVLVRLQIYLGAYPEALTILEPQLESISIPRILSYAAISFFKTNEKDEADKIVKKLISMTDDSPIGSPSFYLATVFAQMGETDTAYEWLEKAYQDHEVEMYWIKVEPTLKPLHSDARWEDMLDKVGFPD